MIGVAVVSQATSVWQTYISNAVGQQVMHDLRAAAITACSRCRSHSSRARTGEVQSRISNDIGGLDNVITSTATTIASNVTTRDRRGRRNVHLELAPAVISLIFVPPVGLVDAQGRENPPPDHHRATAAARRQSALVASRSRCQGSCSARRWAWRRPRRPLHG